MRVFISAIHERASESAQADFVQFLVLNMREPINLLSTVKRIANRIDERSLLSQTQDNLKRTIYLALRDLRYISRLEENSGKKHWEFTKKGKNYCQQKTFSELLKKIVKNIEEKEDRIFDYAMGTAQASAEAARKGQKKYENIEDKEARLSREGQFAKILWKSEKTRNAGPNSEISSIRIKEAKITAETMNAARAVLKAVRKNQKKYTALSIDSEISRVEKELGITAEAMNAARTSPKATKKRQKKDTALSTNFDIWRVILDPHGEDNLTLDLFRKLKKSGFVPAYTMNSGRGEKFEFYVGGYFKLETAATEYLHRAQYKFGLNGKIAYETDLKKRGIYTYIKIPTALRNLLSTPDKLAGVEEKKSIGPLAESPSDIDATLLEALSQELD